MSRGRKDDHILYAMKSNTCCDVFKDVHIQYNSVPELNFSEIDTSVSIFGREFSCPVIINAITGGTEQGFEINRMLSMAAARYNIPIAVGSQAIAVKNTELIKSFTVSREVNPKGFIFANLGAAASVEQAFRAAEMIEADGIQLHLNTLQELIMPEGDRNFKGIIENIQDIKQSINLPIVVKEVGFGMTEDTVLSLKKAGIEYIDIGGYGGTNFARIESMRRKDEFGRNLGNIGIPTAVSLYQASRVKEGVKVICGGGIRTGVDAARAVMMGADAVSMAYILLKACKEEGQSGLYKEIDRIMYELKVSMLVSGALNIRQLSAKKVIITGETLEWIKQLGNF